MNERMWKIGCLWILGTSLTMTGEVKAACTPTPDCASIGYTETSCEGDFVRCPFDISKLYCIPCDSSFKYDCTGANITGGVGTPCNGKYMSCACSSGREFKALLPEAFVNYRLKLKISPNKSTGNASHMQLPRTSSTANSGESYRGW